MQEYKPTHPHLKHLIDRQAHLEYEIGRRSSDPDAIARLRQDLEFVRDKARLVYHVQLK